MEPARLLLAATAGPGAPAVPRDAPVTAPGSVAPWR